MTIDRKALREAEARAKPGPWEVCESRVVSGSHEVFGEDVSIISRNILAKADAMPDGDSDACGPRGVRLPARLEWEAKSAVLDTVEVIGCSEWMRAERADFDAIVAMRNSFVGLLDELDAVTSERDALKKELDELKKGKQQ